MGIISWIILGLIAGFIASKIVNKTGSGLICGPWLGIVGAVVGGFIFSGVFGMRGVTGVNIWSIIVSVIGAIIVLWVYEKVIAKTGPRREKARDGAAKGSSQPVLLDRLQAGVLTLNLNRPERLNALDAALSQALSAGVGRAGTDPECRAVLITGAGRGFCAGRTLLTAPLNPAAPAGPGPITRKGPQSADLRDLQSPKAGRLRG